MSTNDEKTTEHEVKSIALLAQKWWEKHKDNGYFTGGIQHMEWDDLWEDAQEGLTKLFLSANKIGANTPHQREQQKGETPDER